jgi:hypothetical protein
MKTSPNSPVMTQTIDLSGHHLRDTAAQGTPSAGERSAVPATQYAASDRISGMPRTGDTLPGAADTPGVDTPPARARVSHPRGSAAFLQNSGKRQRTATPDSPVKRARLDEDSEPDSASDTGSLATDSKKRTRVDLPGLLTRVDHLTEEELITIAASHIDNAFPRVPTFDTARTRISAKNTKDFIRALQRDSQSDKPLLYLALHYLDEIAKSTNVKQRLHPISTRITQRPYSISTHVTQLPHPVSTRVPQWHSIVTIGDSASSHRKTRRTMIDIYQNFTLKEIKKDNPVTTHAEGATFYAPDGEKVFTIALALAHEQLGISGLTASDWEEISQIHLSTIEAMMAAVREGIALNVDVGTRLPAPLIEGKSFLADAQPRVSRTPEIQRRMHNEIVAIKQHLNANFLAKQVVSLLERLFPPSALAIATTIPLETFCVRILTRTRATQSELLACMTNLERIKRVETDIVRLLAVTPGQAHIVPEARRFFVVAMMLSNKFHQDRSGSNKAWGSITGLPVQEITALETATLGALGFDLNLGDDEHYSLVKRLFAVLQAERLPVNRP